MSSGRVRWSIDRPEIVNGRNPSCFRIPTNVLDPPNSHIIYSLLVLELETRFA